MINGYFLWTSAESELRLSCELYESFLSVRP